MKKNFSLYTAIIFLFLFLSGCGYNGLSAPNTDDTDVILSESSVFVAEFMPTEINSDTIFSLYTQLNGSKLYYQSDLEWHPESNTRTSTFYAGDLLSGEPASVLWEETLSEDALFVHLFFPGQDGQTYYLVFRDKPGVRTWYLVVMDADNKEMKRRDISGIFTSVNSALQVSMGAVDKQGQIYLYSNEGSQIYLLDNDCNFIRTLETPREEQGDSTGMWVTADGTVYLVQNKPQETAFIRLSETQKDIRQTAALPIRDFSNPPGIAGSYGAGLLLWDEEGVFCFNPAENTVERLFAWTDKYINISYYEVKTMSAGADGSIYILINSTAQEPVYLAALSLKDTASLPESKPLSLGIAQREDYGLWTKLVSQFNRLHPEYQIEIVQYLSDDSFYDSQQALYKDILAGTAPDILEISFLPCEALVEKNGLEDLSSYLDASAVLGKEDILEPVRKAGTIDGKLIGITDCFTLSTAITDEAFTDGEGISPDTVLSLMEKYPDRPLFSGVDTYQLLDFLLYKNLDQCINLAEGTCSFDSPEFISLLEAYVRLPEETAQTSITTPEIALEDYKDGKYLFHKTNLSSMEDFMKINLALDSRITWTGYPNKDSLPRPLILPDCIFAINSSSGNKEGAWKFMEFILSSSTQERLCNFPFGSRIPVREDTLTHFLDTSYYTPELLETLNFDMPVTTVTQEDKDALRKHIEGAVYIDYNSNSIIMRIISEETDALLAGDKTPEETASVIQSRILLYLQE